MEISLRPSAKVICDSIHDGNRLTTMEVVMHRFVLAEFNTHRVFSRNSASSRAIPVQKQIDKVIVTPAIPVHWGKNQKGMQAEQELTLAEQQSALDIWLSARDAMVEHATKLLELGVHKQITNRLLEPFMFHTAIVSFTEWNNFELQRCSPLAQPEMAELAYRMREAYQQSTPTEVDIGEWHTPYIDLETKEEIAQKFESSAEQKFATNRISAARCARVSYLTHDGKRDIQEDLNMFDRLKNANPPHMSPLEHVATPRCASFESNVRGWTQLRHLVFGR